MVDGWSKIFEALRFITWFVGFLNHPSHQQAPVMCLVSSDDALIKGLRDGRHVGVQENDLDVGKIVDLQTVLFFRFIALDGMCGSIVCDQKDEFVVPA